MKTPMFSFLIVLVLTNFGCKKNNNCIDVHSNITVPDCIEHKIDSFKTMPLQNPPTSIYQYTYNGSPVYFISSYCCDIPSLLVDEYCNTLCRPDGGLTGNGDKMCTDFFENRTCEILIWKDNR